MMRRQEEYLLRLRELEKEMELARQQARLEHLRMEISNPRQVGPELYLFYL